MAFLSSGDTTIPGSKTLQRRAVTGANVIEGSGCVWEITVAGASYDVNVANYDPSRLQAYNGDLNVKPYIIIKCSVNTAANNVAIKSMDGNTTYYTFAADYSATPRYLVLRLNDLTRVWEAA